jgi:hypothetical protein
LTTAQFVALTSGQFAALVATQVGAIGTANAVAIGSADISALANIASLGTASVLALTTDEIAVIKTGQFVALTSVQFAALQTSQVAAIGTANAVAIGPADIPALANISNLGTASLAALTTSQARVLTSGQVDALTIEQFVALTSNQFAVFSTLQVAAIGTANAIAIGSADISALVNIPSMATSSVAALLSSQVAALTTTQISIMCTAQKAAFSGTQLGALSSAQLGVYFISGVTPIALDLDGNGVRTVSALAGALFDVNADGQAESVGWLSSSDAWLALDRNGNGLIDDGSELFGSGTTMPDGSKALDGFAALRVLDTNHDGVMDGQDAAFANLSVWVDANSNTKTDAGELRSLIQAGIDSLSLVAKPTAIIDQGNLIGLMGSYTTTDGQKHEMADVWLSAKRAGDTLKVSLSDVLSFGDTHFVIGLPAGAAGQSADGAFATRQMVISGDLQDSIQLADAANWTMTGTEVIGASTYRVLTQGLAQLLVEDKVKIVAV